MRLRSSKSLLGIPNDMHKGGNMTQIWNAIDWALGLNADPLTMGHIGLRALIIYTAGWLMVRTVGDRRFIGSHAAFDVVLSVIFGATLSRAINGKAPFFATLAGGLILVGMHWLVATITYRLPNLDRWIKGRSRLLVEDGHLQRSTLHQSHITMADLESSLRFSHLTNLNQVKYAYLERNGDISVIPCREQSVQIIEVSVEAGVQTIRIQVNS